MLQEENERCFLTYKKGVVKLYFLHGLSLNVDLRVDWHIDIAGEKIAGKNVITRLSSRFHSRHLYWRRWSPLIEKLSPVTEVWFCFLSDQWKQLPKQKRCARFWILIFQETTSERWLSCRLLILQSILGRYSCFLYGLLWHPSWQHRILLEVVNVIVRRCVIRWFRG